MAVSQRITWYGSAIALTAVGLVFAAPASAVGQPRSVDQAATVSCPSGDFCAWSGANYTGTKKAYYICQNVLPFASGTGSIYNNQTGGATTTFTLRPNPDGATHFYLAAGARDASWNWSETKSVQTC